MNISNFMDARPNKTVAAVDGDCDLDSLRLKGSEIFYKKSPEYGNNQGTEAFPGVQLDRHGRRVLVWVVRKNDLGPITEKDISEEQAMDDAFDAWGTSNDLIFVTEKNISAEQAMDDAFDAWETSEDVQDIVLTSIRLADKHKFDGCIYHYNYEVSLELNGKRGKFSVREDFANDHRSYSVDIDPYMNETDAKKLFELIEKFSKNKELPDVIQVMKILGFREEVLDALGFRKDPSDELEVQITSRGVALGIDDYWYEIAGNSLHFHDRGSYKLGTAGGSWYSLNSNGLVYGYLSVEERLAIVKAAA